MQNHIITLILNGIDRLRILTGKPQRWLVFVVAPLCINVIIRQEEIPVLAPPRSLGILAFKESRLVVIPNNHHNMRAEELLKWAISWWYCDYPRLDRCIWV